MDCTPRIAELTSRLASQLSDLNTQMEALTKRIGSSDILVLRHSPENIVDRKKDKARHRKQWRLQLHEILAGAIEFEELK